MVEYAGIGSEQEIGNEAWFQFKVGLLVKGLDLGRDCSHVTNY
jgi:hypothetical protein